MRRTLDRCTVLKESSENPDFVRTRELLNGKLSDTALPTPRFSGNLAFRVFHSKTKHRVITVFLVKSEMRN
jgi:hypothetical protein